MTKAVIAASTLNAPETAAAICRNSRFLNQWSPTRIVTEKSAAAFDNDPLDPGFGALSSVHLSTSKSLTDLCLSAGSRLNLNRQLMEGRKWRFRRADER